MKSKLNVYPVIPVLNFLNKKDIRKLYSRLEKTDKGWGRIYVHFRWED